MSLGELASINSLAACSISLFFSLISTFSFLAVFWVELYLKGWFELIDYFCEERWEIISEIVFRSRGISVIALL